MANLGCSLLPIFHAGCSPMLVRLSPPHTLLLVCLVVLCLSRELRAGEPGKPAETLDTAIFAKDNLVAWCIVPFDSQKRSPEQRSAMLEKLGLKRLAYDWRAEHIPMFDAEIAAL